MIELRDCRKITITRLDGLGDIILSMPLVLGLLKACKRARIQLLVREHLKSLETLLPERVDLVTLPFDHYAALEESNSIDNISRVFLDLSERCKADLFILGEYNKVWVSEIIASLQTSSTKILSFRGNTGINHYHDAVIRALNLHPISRYLNTFEEIEADFDEHEVMKYGKILSLLGVSEPPHFSIDVPKKSQDDAVEIFHSLGLSPEQVLIYFPSTADGLKKSLSAGTWVELSEGVRARTGLSPLLVGGPRDADAIQEMLRSGHAPNAVFRLPPDRLDLLAALISISAGYVGADTGVMHLSAAVGRPTFAIFGGGHKAHRFLPVGQNAMAFRMKLGCYGCVWECPFSERLCIKRMPVDTMIDNIAGHLRGDLEILRLDSTPCHVVDIKPQEDFSQDSLGAVQRVYQSFLQANHRLLEAIEHQHRQIEELGSWNHQHIHGMAQLKDANSRHMLALHRLLAKSESDQFVPRGSATADHDEQ